MAAIKPSQKREVEELVSQQIQAFKNVAPMDARDIFEYHLRYFRIMALYREIDRLATGNAGTGAIIRGTMTYFYVKKCSCGARLRVKETSSLQPGFSLAESFRVPCDYCGEIHRGLLSNLEVVELPPETSGTDAPQ